MKTGKKIYFASDFHLGVPTYEKSLEREHRIVRWLDSIRNDAELSDSGIKIHYFTGNHDMWTFDYLEKELNVTIYRAPIERVYNSKTFYIGHGDGLGPGDHGYKFIKKIFASKICQWLFARLHPNFGIGIANYFSKKSRIATGTTDEKFLGEEKEWLVIYSKEILAKKHFDYLIFGHRHLPLDIKINDSRYINLGDWIQYFTYGVFDGENFELKKG